MPSGLLAMWQENEGVLDGKTFRQIIQFSGEGRLRDGNSTSQEVRDLLSAIPLEKLRDFADECLKSHFEDSGLALQDLANELGVRLGFTVTHGRYRGTSGEIGFDGLWLSKDGYALLLEVKTTDAYRINLDTIANYRQQLIDQGKIEESRSSILIAVGRQDTGDLEAQIRGSRHAWDVRLVSIDALLRLAEVKEQMSSWATSMQINELLRPLEYTRLDGIVDLLFKTSRDLEGKDEIEESPSEPDAQNHPKHAPADPPTIAALREGAMKIVSQKLGVPLVKKGRALRSSSDGQHNVVCLVSKGHPGVGNTSYWYGFTPPQRDFLGEAEQGSVLLVAGDSGKVFQIDRQVWLGFVQEMLTTPPDPERPEDIRHWHIIAYDHGDRFELVPSASSAKRSLDRYLVGKVLAGERGG